MTVSQPRYAGAARTTLKLGASSAALALALVLSTQPAQAQAGSSTTGASPQAAADAGAAPASAADAADNSGDIIVTGFRAALRSATAKKKAAEVVVESVSAEDIGKLPDNGIGESIARLPGLSAQRNAGRANIISIRGFGPDFSTTTLNGRQQTTTNDSRAVEFDQYPSEILAGVDVYKTSEADHTAGGLVGSIDLRTIRPLDVKQRVLAVGARGTYVDQKLQPDTSDKGYRVYGTFVDRFADDRVGVALSAAYTDEPYQTRDFNAWGYGAYGTNAYGMNGIKTWSESDKLKRFGANATIQAEASDAVTVTVDGFYSHFVDRIDQRGFEMPLNCGGGCGHDKIVSYQADARGLVTAATINGTPVIENYANDRIANTYGLGGNLKWDNGGRTRALLDVSWSKTDRKDDRLETTAGLGRALPNATAQLSYKLTDKGPVFTSNYNGASSALVLTDVEGWSGTPVQAGYDKIRKSKDDLVELRGEIEHDLGDFLKSVKVGADFTHRTKVLTQDEAFLSPPNGALTAAIPSSLVLAPVQLDRGLGPILAYDPRVLVAKGVLVYLPNTFGASAGYNVEENVWTPYAQLNLRADLGGTELTGNVGVQGIHTSLTSKGATKPTVNDDYWMVLPSLNLNFRTPSDFVIRFAASQQIMRARMDQLTNIINFGIDNSRTPPIYVGSGGNPLLRPYKATAFDLNFEKYFAAKGYVALQTFYKHINTYIDPSAFDLKFDYSGFPKPAGNTPSSPIGQFSGPVNTKGGHILGVELAGTLPFDVFSGALTGFGLTGGFGYTDTKVNDFAGKVTRIPGYSKYVGNLTAFYEASGLSVRGSMRYRSGFLGDFSLFSGGLDRQQVLAETIYDAQIGYDFPATSGLHGLSLYIQGQNLTDTRSATVADVNGAAFPGAWLKYQSYGRRYVGGFTYKF